MNKDRRKQIDEAKRFLNTAINIIENVKEEEDESFNNLSDGLQCTLRGETMENNVGEMEDAIKEINNALENLDAVE